jgi:hypothetical protein
VLREPRYNYTRPGSAFEVETVQEATLARYPLRTAARLKNHRVPPNNIRMLARDYIDDALYNPHYGYFSTKVQIFEAEGREEKGFPFDEMRNTGDFETAVLKGYGEGGGAKWHTPTELFKVLLY